MLVGSDFVCDCGDRDGARQSWEGPTLLRGEKVVLSAHVIKADGDTSFENFGDSLEEGNDAKCGRCVIGGFSWLGEYHPVGVSENPRVITFFHEGGEQRSEQLW